MNSQKRTQGTAHPCHRSRSALEHTHGNVTRAIYLSHVLNSPALIAEKARLGQGNAVVHINARALGGLNLCLPSRDEQDRVVEILEDMDTEIGLLQQQLKKNRALKQGMMHELLTGRTRLAQEAAA